MSLSPPNQSDTFKLHDKFRTLTALLTLVTAVNNGGHPKLGSMEGKGRIYNGLLDEPSSRNKEVLLNAIAALLVRNAEIVAIIPCNQDGEQVVAPETVPDAEYKILAVQELEEEWPDRFGDPFSSYAAITNPDIEDKNCDGDIMLVAGGCSFWKSITKDPWCMLNVSRKKTPALADHIKTLCEYVQEYQGCQESKRTTLFKVATHYLVSSGWRKMRRRINHWSSQGFLSTLGLISDIQLLDAYESLHKRPIRVPKYQKPDTSLAHLFSHLSETDIAEIMNNHFDFPVRQSKLSKLRAAFLKVGQKTESESIQMTGYTAESYIEFQHFLIAVLCSYSAALENLFQQKSDKTENAALTSAGIKVWNLAHLLWRVAYSRTLQYHLSVLQANGLLSIPQLSNKFIYHALNRARGVMTHTEEDEEDEADMNNLNVDVEDCNIAVVYLRWFRLHVTHFVALNIVSAFCARRPASDHRNILDISLLAVHAAPRSINSWEQAIRDLALPSPDAEQRTFDADAIISFIKNAALDGRIVGIFERIEILPKFNESSFEYSVNVHCEAALAALLQYSKYVAKTEGSVLELMAKTDGSLISVSKLCCPVCWDLLEVLRESNTNLMKVRGRHTTIFPVHLPSWLPSEIMRTMVERYQNYLYKELVKMTELNVMKDSSKSLPMSASGNHSRTPSMQSASGISDAGSDNSGLHRMDPVVEVVESSSPWV